MLSSAFTVWLTGLPASGKTTIAECLSGWLANQKISHEVFDGDVIRKHLSYDLGFSKRDRDANVKRVAYICSLLNKHGICCVVAMISPFKETRNYVRQLIENFVEIYVDCPLEECIARDPKGLYKKALAGEIQEFTGISSPYESPDNPELHFRTDKETIDEILDSITNFIIQKFMLPVS